MRPPHKSSNAQSGMMKGKTMAKFEMTTFTAPEKSNEWDEPIAALAAATDANEDDANIPAITAFIDWKGRNAELLRVREAAKKVNKTLRIRTEDESALEQIGQKENGKKIFQGEVRYVFTLTAKYKDGRGRKPAAQVESEAEPAKTAKSTK